MRLIPGEELTIDSADSQEAAEISDDRIDTKYVSGEVRIVTEQARYPLSSIPVMINSGDYQLNPDFQRRHRWDSAKQSRLIESFIMNVPIPPIFLYEDEYSHYEVMDGLQRLTAIVEFYNNRLVLDGLQEWPELNGRTYKTLPEQLRRGVDRRYLSSIILLQETAKNQREAQRLKQLVFERINSGGVMLEPQESRNAIYDGPLNRLCIRLARTPALCKTWDIPEPTTEELEDDRIPPELLSNPRYQKMFDVELVLRFFAYRQRLRNQRGPLKTYYDNYLRLGNLFQNEVLFALESLFKNTIELAYETLGVKAFWLYRKIDSGWQWRKRPTTVVFDPLMYVISGYVDRANEVIEKREIIAAGIKALFENETNEFEGRYTNLANIQKRNGLFQELFSEILD
jgi:hypothetical protein